MEEYKRIFYSIALTDISFRVAPYVAAFAKQLDAEVHLLHAWRCFDWFVDTYIPDLPEPDFKRIVSDFESRALEQTRLNKARHLRLTASGRCSPHRQGECCVASGTHYKGILDDVDTERSNLIVMDSRITVQTEMFGR